MPPIFVIHRKTDRSRLEFLQKSYDAAGLDPKLIDAVDGHDLEALAPYSSLIGAHFWGKDEVKPGALGCFLSHRRAWQALLDQGHEWAIIAEDDSAVASDFKARWPEIFARKDDAGLLFLNNRIAHWASAAVQSLDAALENHTQIENAPYKAPGADAYLLHKNVAEKLLTLSKHMGMICGVDWFIIGAMRQNKTARLPQGAEFAFIQKAFATAEIPGEARILQNPLFEIEKSLPSSIRHKHRVAIQTLKNELAQIQRTKG